MVAILNRKSRIAYFIYVIIAVIIWILGFNEMPEILDVSEYKLYSKSLTDGMSVFELSDRWMEDSRRTPFYPILISFNNNFYIIRLLQLFSWLAYPLISNQILKKLSLHDVSIEHWVIVLTSLFPLGYYYSFITIPDIFTGILLGLWIIKTLDKKFFIASLISAVLIGLKPIFIFTLLLFPFFAIADLKKWFLSLFIVVFAIISLMFWNYHRTNRFEISSVSTTNLYDYNRKLVLRFELGTETTDSIYQAEKDLIQRKKLNEIQLKKFLRQQSVNTILEYPLTYLFIHFKGMFATIIDPGRFDAMVYWGWKRSRGFLDVNDGHQQSNLPWFQWIYFAAFLAINIIRGIVFSLGIWRNRQNLKVLWLCFLIITYLFFIGPVGSARYLIPIIIPIISISVLGLRNSLLANSK